MPLWDFPNPPFGKEICHHSKWDQITQVQESAGSAVGDINTHKAARLQSKGWQDKHKFIIFNVFDS